MQVSPPPKGTSGNATIQIGQGRLLLQGMLLAVLLPPEYDRCAAAAMQIIKQQVKQVYELMKATVSNSPTHLLVLPCTALISSTGQATAVRLPG